MVGTKSFIHLYTFSMTKQQKGQHHKELPCANLVCSSIRTGQASLNDSFRGRKERRMRCLTMHKTKEMVTISMNSLPSRVLLSNYGP